MEYLLSLVGKDENTIVEAIKDLASNSEKVKAQESEIKELIKEKNEDKEEIHYLKKKLDQKYNLIDDMENELEHIERKLKESQKEVELKERDFNQLKMLITDQVEEINILRENNQSMISQIADNIQMENKIKHQEEVIKDLEEKLSVGKLQSEGWKTSKSNEEKQYRKLQKEIKEIEIINTEKAKELEKLETENVELKVKIEFLEIGMLESQRSLAEEIKDAEKNVFKCEECANTFYSKSDLKHHIQNVHERMLWKVRLLEMETANSRLKHQLYSDLFRMKELEVKAKESCSCRGFCSIAHSKHNWTRFLSDEILCRLEKSSNFIVNKHDCQTCEQSFLSSTDFIQHIENSHKNAEVYFLQN